jgi:hypothetical protein
MYYGFTVNELNLQEFTVQPQTECSDLVWQLNLHRATVTLSHSKEASINKILECTVIGNMMIVRRCPSLHWQISDAIPHSVA